MRRAHGIEVELATQGVLRTGECRDVIYDADMRRARPIRRP